MLWLWITLGVIGLILLLFLSALYYVYHSVFYSPHKGQNNDFVLTDATNKYCDKNEVIFMINRIRDYPYEDAYITSFDRVKLHARIYRNESDTVAIMFHGYRGTPCRDFSGGAYDMIKFGFNVILVDERAHGLSKGHSITFGVKEKKDAKCWLEYAKKEFGEDKRIILVGISMGGATVLLASDLLKEGDLVIADCPYSRPQDIIKETLTSTLKMNPKSFYPIANMSSILFGHANLSKDDAVEHVKRSKAKFLIIHGDDDHIVPHKQSLRIYEENKDKVKYELFPGVDHGISYLGDNARYKKVVEEFVSGK